MTEIKPDKNSPESKKVQVEAMFDSIAQRYDLLNHLLSMGIDKGWRRKAIGHLLHLKNKTGIKLLDIATGTGDLAIEAHKQLPAASIIGLDLSEQMLQVGRVKMKKLGLEHTIQMVKGESEALPYQDNFFDAITVAFGVRNFQDLEGGLKEMYRVLKPGGRLVVLEFSKPAVTPFKQIFQFYFTTILPLWGNLLSRSSNAYSYLPESVKHFPEGKAFAAILENCSYQSILVQPLTFGTCSLYVADK